jgi:hypothetical protein
MDHMSEDGGRSRNGLKKFLSEALLGLRQRELLLPALILLVLLTASNIVILQNMPAKGSPPPAPFAVAAIVRIAGLLAIAVAILRMLTASPRRRWMPDGGFWLYVLTFAAGIAASALVRLAIGERMDLPGLIASNVLVALLLSPLIVWFVATAVAKPLAWRPAPWLRSLRLWWLPTIFWTLLLVTPMGVLHAWIDMRLAKGVGDGFWPLALFDGALSTLMALLGLAINAAAYRRVAEAPASRLSAEAQSTS